MIIIAKQINIYKVNIILLNMVKVADLMARVEKDIQGYSPFLDELYDDMKHKPHKYRAEKTRERTELRKIGINFIPEKGRVLHYINNYEICWVDDPKYPKNERLKLRSEFPELFNPGERAIVERVEEVIIKTRDQVELRIGRYIIEKKSSSHK